MYIVKCLGLSTLVVLASTVNAQVQPKQPDTIVTPPPGTTPQISPTLKLETPDTPGALWVAASPGNFGVANRPTDQAIDMIVIHDIEGSAEGAVSWFQNPRAKVSSHYVVNSTAGKVWQMVKEKDVAYHAGNLSINRRSVGIEHEGYAYRPGFYNPVEYEAAAKLVRSITSRYNIPRDRTHIISHAEVPHPSKPGFFGGASGHTDPGPYWDWASFMTLVRNDARLIGQNFPGVIHPGELIEASAIFMNTGDDAWPADRKGMRDPILQQKGKVYLGTWNALWRASPFFNYKFWISPRIASEPVDGDVASNAQSRFAFTLLGPRTLGEYTEQFRMVKVPVAPGVPVGFGDVLTAVIRVEPWDVVKDVTQSGFTAEGWKQVRQHYTRSAVPATSAAVPPTEWKLELPISGAWDVYARWPAAASNSSKAFYQIEGSDKTYTVVVDQRKGKDWFKLGRYQFANPKAVRVLLSARGGKGFIVADAVRFMGPFPAQP